MDTRNEGKHMAHVKHGHAQITTIKEAPQGIQDCIDECMHCSTICRDTASHCLLMGDEHARPEHVWLLLDCSEICQTSAHFMMHNSPLHHATCGACAEVCERCAEDCESMQDDPMMQACAEACRRCAESCARMAEKQ